MFAFIDFESGLLTDKRLGIRELKVYIVLAGHADQKTRICWPSRKRISDLTGIHPSNVSVATRKLEECGYLEKRIIQVNPSYIQDYGQDPDIQTILVKLHFGQELL